ncbi:MAG: DUF4292 domain-containing protein [Bacteroidales bacterium]|nr:DUF4292 domain-containing protein [Bacteroidales bacterium]
MKTVRSIALVLAVVSLSACHTTHSVSTSTQPQSPEEAESWRYLVANFRAMVEGVQANGQVRVARDSALWIAAYKMVELGRMLATTDSVWINLPLMGRQVAGTYAELESRTGAKWSYGKLQAAVLSDEASQRIAALLAELGFDAKVEMGEKKIVEHTDFPIAKP